MLSPTRVPLLAVAIAAVLSAELNADDKVSFNRDVRPILNEACFRCHGPATRKGGFRLDQQADATKPAKSGATPIVPGKPHESEVIARIFSNDAGDVMPPPSSHKSLKPAEKELLKKWIAEGAVYQKHWSFEPQVKAPIPAVSQPNPIDAFIVSRLQKEGLKLSPEADRPTLVRRVAFALTGLPPTIAEVDAFVADKSPDAYEKMVDRFLASPRYGEEMARHWLDVARYADTHGLHLDNERQMWLYRDWVVNAFNDNMPFDRFTTEQLAGDLIPNATSEQLVATGFNRCNVTTGEGGSIDAEWVFRNAVDRTSTMTQAWLALTAGCAVCHDHKFDPISAKEFYSLYAFFYSAAGPALDGNALLTEPSIRSMTPEQTTRIQKMTDDIAKLKRDVDEMKKSIAYAEPADEKAKEDPARSFAAWLKQKSGKDNKELPPEIKNVLKQATVPEAQHAPLRDYYVQFVWADAKPKFEPLAKQIAELGKQKDAASKSVAGTFVFKELPKPRQSTVMMRGQYDKAGEKVEPGVPSEFPPLKVTGRATRLDLARWLVAPEHPLTARVAVNRYWQQFFGVGLVKSSDDFGTQGQLPSHPELLDWLAISFRENGWDVKALTRLTLTSATFRQSAAVTPESLKRDPENRLYARGPRFRLDAEQIRDNALFVSGLINLQMGGRGVRIYQPPRIWEPVAFVGSNTMNYKEDKGPALYRRSIYVFFKRTAPPPCFANFDAPNRESFCSRRERSNTPLQALQLMNDVQHVEAARALAERVILEGGTTPAERIRYLYRTVLSRPPEDAEAEIVAKTLEQYRTRFQNDAEAAKKLIRVGDSAPRPNLPEPEVAAYVMIANMILNLDETVTRN